MKAVVLDVLPMVELNPRWEDNKVIYTVSILERYHLRYGDKHVIRKTNVIFADMQCIRRATKDSNFPDNSPIEIVLPSSLDKITLSGIKNIQVLKLNDREGFSSVERSA